MNEHDRAMRVLLIEDRPGEARLIQELLTEATGAGVAIKWADTLGAGLEWLATHPADAVLLDLSLPDAQGLDTLRALQTRFGEVPVVVLTGLDDRDTAVQAVHEGAQDYLVKG